MGYWIVNTRIELPVVGRSQGSRVLLPLIRGSAIPAHWVGLFSWAKTQGRLRCQIRVFRAASPRRKRGVFHHMVSHWTLQFCY